MKNLEELYLTSRSIEQCQPKIQPKSSRKIEKQTIKQTNKKNKIIAKTLKLLPPGQNLIPLNIPL